MSYPIMPGPGYNDNTHTFGDVYGPRSAPIDEELMYSANGFTQHGCTLAPGQGVVRIGSAVVWSPSMKKYYKFGATTPGDLEDDVYGLLRHSYDTGMADEAHGGKPQMAVAVECGMVKRSIVLRAHTTNGVLDPNFDDILTSLNARSYPRADFISF